MPEFEIRQATVADAAAIARHRAEMFRDMGSLADDGYDRLAHAARAWLEAGIPAGRYVAWVATPSGHPGEVIAGVGVHLREILPRPSADRAGVMPGPQGLIVNVYTARAWRRRGIAAALMRRLLDWTREAGIENLVLHASDEGRPLYEALGFVATNEMRYAPTTRTPAAR